MNLIQIEALVLRATLFKEYDRILTLFSQQGIIKLFVKGSKREYLHISALSAPLTLAEFHYTPGRKELHRMQEGCILKQHLAIRDHFETLMAAEKMIEALLASQWPGKPAPKLFDLFSLFIDHLSKLNPSLLTTTFLLKILMHEGVLQLSPTMAEIYRYAGERYSKEEAPNGSIYFNKEEECLLTELSLSRSLVHLNSCSISLDFQKKIDLLFSQSL